jgi:hypothetical protein
MERRAKSEQQVKVTVETEKIKKHFLLFRYFFFSFTPFFATVIIAGIFLES